MLDSLNEAISLLERSHRNGENIDFAQVVDFIVGQQIRYGHDAGVFVESRNVSRLKARTYTGEKLQTHLAVKNILTIDSARALVLFGSSSKTVSSSIALTDSWFENQCFSDFCATGECRHSSVAFIRYLNARGSTERIEHTLSKLSSFRDGNGGWKGFPYFYTILALVEIESQAAENELRYAIPNMEQRFKRCCTDDLYISRRKELLVRVNNRCGQALLTHA